VLNEEPPDPWRHSRRRQWAALRELSDRTPLRTKLITAVLALVILAMLVIGIASTYMLRSNVLTQRDRELQTDFLSYANSRTLDQLAQNPGNAVPIGSLIMAVQQPGAQLTWSPGTLFPNSEPLPQLPTSDNWASGPKGVLLTRPSLSGPDTWRVVAGEIPATTTNGTATTITFVVGVNLDNINAMTRHFVLFELIVGGGIVLVLAAVGIGVIRANLRPLNDIEMTAGQIARGRLNHRVPERDPRTEIGSLGHSLNAMLSQVEAAFHAQEQSERAAHQSEERMRRFIADASHELRTPLTTIRGFAEYYRQRGGIASGTDSEFPVAANGSSGQGLTPEDLGRIMHRLESEASRMGVLVEDLLLLARLDQQRPLNMQLVDVLTLAADAVQDARMVAPDRPIDLIVAPGAAYLVNGDEARLRQVIGNLVNNALSHTSESTPVRVRIGVSADQPEPAVVLDVEDDGPGMTAEQAQRVFERFYRADKARSRASGGTGLGLSIVASLVAAHGGTVSVRTAPGEGADFQVRLPLSPEAQGYDEDLDAAEPPA
jgi:two-component system OmpR family sensor kinase